MPPAHGPSFCVLAEQVMMQPYLCAVSVPVICHNYLREHSMPNEDLGTYEH